MRMLGLKAGQTGLLCGVFLFQVAIGLSGAQSAEPAGAPALQPSGEVAKDAKESGPFGGCEPIGMTASGELVFPLECKKLIKKPAEAPVAADDKAAADDKTASTDAKPATPSQSAAAENPASTDSKAGTSEAAVVAPATSAEHKHQGSADKPDAQHKAASLDSAPVAKPSVAKPAVTKQTLAKPTVIKPSLSKAAPGKSVEAAAKDTAKDTAAKAAQADAAKSARATRVASTRPMIVLAKPMAAATALPAKPQSDDKPRLRTAGMPACMQFRSYNPTTKSYRGYDGHIYACH